MTSWPGPEHPVRATPLAARGARSTGRRGRARQAARHPGEKPDEPRARRLVCRACGQPVTSEDQRVRIEGRHTHRRVNPHGIEFEFGCFGAAAGATGLGVPTREYTWFAGYGWSVDVCRGCRIHLGWLFSGAERSFHGLILARLREED